MSNKKNISIFNKLYLIGGGLVLGLATALAITMNTTETQWSINDFDTGDKITQNMLMGQILGYTCNNTDCSQKIYWKKISTSQASNNDAAKACEEIGMYLPSADQIGYFAAYNNRYGLNMGTYTAHNSMTNYNGYHWTNIKRNTSSSCSTPGYSCRSYERKYPNSWSSYQDAYGYQIQYYYCVYKQWYS